MKDVITESMKSLAKSGMVEDCQDEETVMTRIQTLEKRVNRYEPTAEVASSYAKRIGAEFKQLEPETVHLDENGEESEDDRLERLEMRRRSAFDPFISDLCETRDAMRQQLLMTTISDVSVELKEDAELVKNGEVEVTKEMSREYDGVTIDDETLKKVFAEERSKLEMVMLHRVDNEMLNGSAGLRFSLGPKTQRRILNEYGLEAG